MTNFVVTGVTLDFHLKSDYGLCPVSISLLSLILVIIFFASEPSLYGIPVVIQWHPVNNEIEAVITQSKGVTESGHQIKHLQVLPRIKSTQGWYTFYDVVVEPEYGLWRREDEEHSWNSQEIGNAPHFSFTAFALLLGSYFHLVDWSVYAKPNQDVQDQDTEAWDDLAGQHVI